jgi:ankyrin repeat protein
MSHAELLEMIQANDALTAWHVLAEDARLCTGFDEPSALMLALYRGMPFLADAIAARRTGLTVFEAASCGNIAALESALRAQADAPRALAADGFTALHLACFFGQAHAVAVLLQGGADPNARARNASFARPLHSGAAHGHAMICHMLLHAGANPDATQQGGYTVLHAAALRNDVALAELMLAYGASRAIRADDGRTAREIARDAAFGELAALL